MHRYHDGNPVVAQNTTISAIVVVSPYYPAQRRFAVVERNREELLGRKLTDSEHFELLDQFAAEAPGFDERVVGVAVY